MRIARLDLLRFGHITDRLIELPRQEPDFHIIYGPNEAGKSTTLAAVEDFLFGIPARSPHNFLHQYKEMRIGAVLEQDGEMLEALRRKGTKDTLITPQGTAYPEGERQLSTLLGGADQGFFTRMFSLDHERLRQGGQDIVEAKDDVGEMLFSASAGILGLRERLNALRDEGNALWGPRRASHRRYYQLDDQLKSADNALREHIVTSSKWQELKRALEKAEQEYQACEEQIALLSTEQRKVSRIRRVYRNVKRIQEVDEGLAEMADIPDLPEDAAQTLAEAERQVAEAGAIIKNMNEQLDALNEAHAGLDYDETLVLRAKDIEQLEEARGRARDGKIDLPGLKAKLAVKEGELGRHAAELGWDSSDLSGLFDRIPERTKVVAVQRLAHEYGELATAVKVATRASKETKEERDRLVRERNALGESVELAPLEGTIAALRRRGDISTEMKHAQKAINDAEAQAQRGLQQLTPSIKDPETLSTLAIPPVATMQAYRDRYRDLQKQAAECQKRLSETEGEIERLKQTCERTAQEKGGVTEDALDGLRAKRDQIWNIIHRHYIEGDALTDEDQAVCAEAAKAFPGCYEDAVVEADNAADRRFETAEQSAQLSLLARQIDDAETQRNSLETESNRLEEQREELETEWSGLWGGMPFLPESPDNMLVWNETRSEILDALGCKSSALRDLEALRTEEAESRQALLDALAALKVNMAPLEALSLTRLIESADTVARDFRKENDERDRLDTAIRELSDAEIRRDEEFSKAGGDLNRWRKRWSPAVQSLALAESTDPEDIVDQINTLEEMRGIAAEIYSLRHDRIDAIETHMDAFEQAAHDLVTAVAPDLTTWEAEAASVELHRRLQQAKQNKAAQEAKGQEITQLTDKRANFIDSTRSASEIIDRLLATAHTDQIDKLRHLIEKSDQRRHLNEERAQIVTRLQTEGDGFSLVELIDECEDVDLDEIASHDETLVLKLRDLNTQLVEAGQVRQAASQEFESVGGDDAAALAEADRQAALAEMKEVAEHYAQVRTAERLLQWAIERYRQEKQAPLLTAAGEYFALLTEGAYGDLRLDYDESDQPYLVGLRPGGAHVSVDAMSTGTADQLYLALRLAAIDDYLARANPLPLVADDLFINFDNARAVAGLRVLNQLARKTQVIFFTHHWHLVALAREAIDTGVSMVSLDTEATEYGATG